MGLRAHLLVFLTVFTAVFGALALSRDVAGKATPVATPTASCLDAAIEQASPAAALSEQAVKRMKLVLATEMIIECRNSEDWTTFAGLLLPELALVQFGTTDSVAFAGILSKMHDAGFFDPVEVDTIGEPSATPAFGSINLTIREGHVLHRQEWLFALEQGAWLLSGIVASAPLFDVNAVGIPVTLDATGLSAFRSDLVNPGAVVFDLVNSLDQPVSFAIFRTGSQTGSDVRSDLLRGVAPGPGSVIGWTEVPAGETRGIALVDLPAGNYLIVAGYDPRLEVEPVDESAIVEVSIED